MAKETIHSGHFMTSNPHTDELILCDDEPVEVGIVVEEVDRTNEGVDESGTSAEQEDKPVTFFKFGPKQTKSIAIDVSLHKLNKCIKVAYNKMTTPKWKNFQGFKLRRKQQIRLNNVIWRAYYMQFRSPCRNKSYSYFIVPDCDISINSENRTDDKRSKKRSSWSLLFNLKRWRNYKERRRRLCKCMDGIARKMLASKFTDEVKQLSPKVFSSVRSFDVDFENDFMYAANVRGMADVMQPALVSLQPSIPDIMASFDGSPQMSNEDELFSNMSTTSYSDKDYNNSSLLVDYNNQTQPTRQPSSISPVLRSNSAIPTYSQASSYEPISNFASISFGDNSTDYIPQFLMNSPLHSSSVMPSRPYWSTYPVAHSPSQTLFGGSSLSSPLMLNPTVASPFPISSPTSAFTLNSPISTTHISTILSPSGGDPNRTNTPTKGALKAYPSQNMQKLIDKWSNTANSSLFASSPEPIGISVQEHSVWRPLVTSASLSPLSLPVPSNSQIVHSQVANQTASPNDVTADSPPVPPVAVIKQEDEKDSSRPRSARSSTCENLIESTERKRILHLNAEQNRRMALKDGVEQLSSVLPDIYGTPAKPTNAAILARAADYIDELTKEIRDGNEKVKEKQKQIEKLSKKVSSLQASLPSQSSSSASCPSNQGTLIRQYADRYIKENSKDLRFWMMARMLQPVIDSLVESLCINPTNCRATTSASVDSWVHENWFASKLRPLASNFLFGLASHTPVLTNEKDFEEFARSELSKR